MSKYSNDLYINFTAVLLLSCLNQKKKTSIQQNATIVEVKKTLCKILHTSIIKHCLTLFLVLFPEKSNCWQLISYKEQKKYNCRQAVRFNPFARQ